MRSRNILYTALFLILTGFSLNIYAILPDSRQYIVHLQENTAETHAAEATSHGSVLIMVSPAGESVQFTATLNNTPPDCNLTLYAATDCGKSREIANLNPTTFKIERAGEEGNRVHLSGTLTREDLAEQVQAGSMEEFCRLLQDGAVFLQANFASVSQNGFAG
ncbi:MAG: hypothetical protein GF372_05385 [Candidatus Marinimicrobia bacterium]|nr:hypothetical protein [Candidatus Neomarinimicrobiota bacterium]